MNSAIEGISGIEKDWTEIKMEIAQMDTETLFKYPKTLYLADSTLSVIKNNTDTPSLIEALS
eukprot:863113-Ditylum_brightwellii.AAC.1